jgi:hypothetical protein
LIRLGDHATPLFVGAREIVERFGAGASFLERLANLVDVFPDVIEIEHLVSSDNVC